MSEAAGGPLFFKVVTVEEARRSVLEALGWSTASRARGVEELAIEECAGRVLAADLVAPEDVPGFPRSTVDGYAVRAQDTYGAGESLPAYLVLAGELRMGEAPEKPLGQGECMAVATGGALPEGADAVVMLEHTETPGDGTVAVMRPVSPGENLVRPGEDIREGQVVLPRGRVLRPPDLGVAAALGYTRLPVYARPRVAIISTGDELVPPGEKPGPGQVRDVNACALAAAVRGEGGIPRLLGIVPDDRDALDRALREGLESDCVIVSGGSSVGARDLVAGALAELGEPGVLVHGVAVRPGKPVIIAVARGKPVYGLPGHPVSALVTFYLLVRPVIRYLAGADPFPVEPTVRARLGRNLASRAGVEEYVRVSLTREGAQLVAHPVLGKSGLISTLARAWGLVRIPAEATGLAEGEEVEVVAIPPL
ncbi:MAG: molybdopterin molybdotransferase MoeA [Firmicutes bacterium]|nr:molybdopterin molybdotransferase MoeA [Bacillota bacterium]